MENMEERLRKEEQDHKERIELQELTEKAIKLADGNLFKAIGYAELIKQCILAFMGVSVVTRTKEK